jgi:hypothetical protein
VTVTSLPCAETAHLADDRFRPSARQSRHDCIGDGAGVAGRASGEDQSLKAPLNAERNPAPCAQGI